MAKKKMDLSEGFAKATIKEFAFHLKTIGAFVQNPIPGVYGLDINSVIASVDAKSLYPTMMCNGNIGFDTLFGRVYDDHCVGNIIGFIQMVLEKKHIDPKIVPDSIDQFKKLITQATTSYLKRHKGDSAQDYKIFVPAFYGELFRTLVLYPGPLENILQPKTDFEYYLLKSCLFPILEAITWIHQTNKGYNNTIVDYLFQQEQFREKYKDRKFYVFDNINSVQSQFRILDMNTFIEYYATKFNLNPYGTLFYKHYDKKSFEVDIIFNGMSTRKSVKDQGLVLSVVANGWDKLTDPEKGSFYDTNEKIDNMIAQDILDKIGEIDINKRDKQFKILTGIDFDLSEKMDRQHEITSKPIEQLLQAELQLLSDQRDSEQNGKKVSLNSGYGLYAMVNWDYMQTLVSNSITTAGKIPGIKLFQQVAVNVNRNERASWDTTA